jgi:hypothetical protein
MSGDGGPGTTTCPNPRQTGASRRAPPQLKSIHGTRCDPCGDIRLYQLLKDGTTDPAIRIEIDELAWMLTEAYVEGLFHQRH